MMSSDFTGALPPALSTRLFTENETHLIPYLAAIHANCITADHSIVTFLPPVDQDKLLKFWKDVIADIREDKRFMILLFDESEPQPPQSGLQLMGAVTLSVPYSETGPFRGWVEKLIVSPKFRRRGGATALMKALEAEAYRRGRTLLMTDTESGTVAENLYRKLGYVEVGRIPNYAISPGGGLKSETFFYKQLS
ncbi:hypothetical protein jhhlp_003727 [Lomentospora prolificans]|uniref:N-acetyltransferase domain-containing protein n=1 Tax=Lomentospora prolificans TaxID=41688 RepID=A0A2N3N9J4_9PEZI|nr:hypothetical protein jhhlp_003727 [Lomentospora prolificans]